MKKKFSIFLILILLLSSCGGNTETSSDSDVKVEVDLGSDSSPYEECLSDDSVETLTSEIAEITSELRNQEKTLALSANGITCNPKLIQEWKIIEKDCTRILTFFIGFFVSFSINNYFKR